MPRQTAESLPTQFNIRSLRYLPPDYAADPMNARDGDGRGWPLVIFLHGIGERGDDVRKVAFLGPPRLVADGHDFPFVLISPQCDSESWWNADLLVRLVDDAVKTLHVDPDRVYITGLSMGGFGTWDVIRRRPDRFAAAVPVCGGGDPILFAPGAKSLPVWAFHGEKDPIVPLMRSEMMVSALKATGNPEVKLTVYPGVGHDSWTQTYNDPAMWTWLLSHRRGQATTKPMTQP